MRNIIILGGLSHPKLTAAICRNLTVDPSTATLRKFSNGETSVEIHDLVREKDVYIVQSGAGSVNDNFIELLIMISACKIASARRVVAVLPTFPYLSQPGKVPLLVDPFNSGAQRGNPTHALSFLSGVDETGRNAAGYKQWVSQNGTLVANLLQVAGADRCITMDLHDPQFQGFFDIGVDNLYLRPLFKRYMLEIPDYEQCVVVSPDSGGAKRAIAIADALGCPFALIHKERTLLLVAKSGRMVAEDAVSALMLVGQVRGKVCVLIDDLADTCTTVVSAARLLKENGATKVYVLVTHAVFSGDALQRVKASCIDKFVTTNSISQTENQRELGDMFEVLDVLRIFAEAIRRIHNGESVSMLFDNGW